MDPEFAAYLERVRSHRAELGESMAALDAALALPVGLGPLWRRRVRAALTELAHDLRDHRAVTEEPGGLYADAVSRAPRLPSVSKRIALRPNSTSSGFITSRGRWPLLR